MIAQYQLIPVWYSVSLIHLQYLILIMPAQSHHGRFPSWWEYKKLWIDDNGDYGDDYDDDGDGDDGDDGGDGHAGDDDVPHLRPICNLKVVVCSWMSI